MPVKEVVFNGKFLSAEPTAVHRVAQELIGAVDEELDREPELRARLSFTIACPRGARRSLALRHIVRETGGLFTWQPWEQLDLPRLARGRLLVSLCNLAPLATRRAITLIHDAQVYLTPESYGRAFRAWYRFALPIIGRRHARVLTVSEYSREQLARFGVAAAERITVVHNGVDHVLRAAPDGADDAGIARRLGLDARPFAVGFSSLQAHKNVKVLLEAFGRAELAGMRLVLVGATGREALERAGASVPGSIVFPGRVTDAELAALLRSATALVFPSTTEGFGLPPGEAMMVGCPVIAAPRGSLPEVCGDAALYAEPDDPAAWSSSLRSLTDDPGARSSLVERGRARAARFTWRDAARRLLDVIESV